MITEKNIEDLKIILSNLSYKDYIEAYRKSARYLKGPYTKSGRQRRFKGYTLSHEAAKVHNYIIMALNPDGFIYVGVIALWLSTLELSNILLDVVNLISSS